MNFGLFYKTIQPKASMCTKEKVCGAQSPQVLFKIAICDFCPFVFEWQVVLIINSVPESLNNLRQN